MTLEAWAAQQEKGADAPVLQSVAQQLLAQLAPLHEEKKAHGGVRPAAVRMTPNPENKVFPFTLKLDAPEENQNLDKLLEENDFSQYQPQEVQLKGKVTLAADIWALGCVLFELAAKVSPFKGQTLRLTISNVMNTTFEAKLPEELHDEVKKFIMSMLKKEPAARPAVSTLIKTDFVTQFGQTMRRIAAEVAEMTADQQTRLLQAIPSFSDELKKAKKECAALEKELEQAQREIASLKKAAHQKPEQPIDVKVEEQIERFYIALKDKEEAGERLVAHLKEKLPACRVQYAKSGDVMVSGRQTNIAAALELMKKVKINGEPVAVKK